MLTASEATKMPVVRTRRLTVTRTVDIAAALAGLILLAPLMALVALLIYAESRGPIFFSQIRLGQGGRHFRLYKFRKFHERPGETGHAVTLHDDERFTHVGKLLARTKLDELPQLWNVLRSDMSIVGPRPETLDFADCFAGAYGHILDYRPGIFGPNQVFFRHESAIYPKNGDPRQFYRDVLFPLKARVDLTYFPRRTLLSDVAWIVRGAVAIFDVSPPAGDSRDWVRELEMWIQRSNQRDHATSVARQRF
jgi:lipopolysaccharide/colanic/teichoic acid biosynthesis glycosyltransferase